MIHKEMMPNFEFEIIKGFRRYANFFQVKKFSNINRANIIHVIVPMKVNLQIYIKKTEIFLREMLFNK